MPNVSTSTTVSEASTSHTVATVNPDDNASVQKSKRKSRIKHTARKIVSKKKGVKRSVGGMVSIKDVHS